MIMELLEKRLLFNKHSIGEWNKDFYTRVFEYLKITLKIEPNESEVKYLKSIEVNLLFSFITDNIQQLLLQKDCAPVNVPNWVFIKWQKHNPGELVEILGKTISLPYRAAQNEVDAKLRCLIDFYKFLLEYIEHSEGISIKIETINHLP